MDNNLTILNQIATYLKVKPKKLTASDDAVATCLINDKVSKGFVNVVNEFLKNSTKTNLTSSNLQELAEIYQWIEYALIYICNNSTSQFLPFLNNILASRGYFVGHRLTIADIVVYYALYNHLENLSYLDKEKFLNVSRWFDNLQQDKLLRQKNKLIDFSTNFLGSIAPARH